MNEPFYAEGFELFECPICRGSNVKYRYDFDPEGNLLHWGECDFSLCHAHHELHYPDKVPEDPISLLVVENLSQEQILEEIFKRDPIIRKASERLKELSEDPEFLLQYLKWKDEK